MRFWTSSRLYYSLTALISCIAAAVVMHLWRIHPHVPLYYSRGGDELVMLSWTKALIDDGWYTTISHLGAPFGMSFGDFPVPSLLHLIVLRAITLLIPNAALALNLYFLAGFPLIALVSAYVLRRLGMSWGTTIAIAVLYSLLPNHFMRNEAHFFYAQYFFVPLLALALIWIFRDHALFDTATRRPTRDGWIFLASLFAISWDNEYNAVFAMLLLVLAAAASLVRTHAWRGTIAAVAGIVVIFAGVEIELLPTTVYHMQHGTNTAALIRPPQAAEIYALTFAQLVLPIQGHRIPAVEQRREYYDSQLPMLVNENSDVTLGALGALGFVGSLAALILMRTEKRDDLWPDLARLNLAAFLLATIGGAGAIISYYFVPELRAYNRISPLIGFASLATVGIVLEYVRRRWFSPPARDVAWYAVVTVVAVLAIFDQTSAEYVPSYDADRQAYVNDGVFAATLEQRLPANANVYQIPHMLFPEGPPVEQMGSWDQTALYLQSHGLHYSFGATRGRDADNWQQNTDALPARAFLEDLVLAGFDGVLVYRNGYADHGAAEDAALTAQLGEAPAVQQGGAISFYDLSALRKRYTSAAGAEAAGRVRDAVLNTRVTAALGDGFYATEMCGSSGCNWAQKTATIIVNNASSTALPVTLDIVATTAQPQHASLSFHGPGLARTVSIDANGEDIAVPFLAPPGASHVDLATDALPLAEPGEQRDRRFRLLDWSVRETPAAEAAAQVGHLLRPVAATIPANISAEFGAGCYGPEQDASHAWHWCGNTGEVTLRNDSGQSYAARLQYALTTAKPSTVAVRMNGSRRIFASTPQGNAVDETIVIPPGRTIVQFSSDAQPVVAPGDARRLVIQISNLKILQPKAVTASK